MLDVSGELLRGVMVVLYEWVQLGVGMSVMQAPLRSCAFIHIEQPPQRLDAGRVTWVALT
jgi:hypothetical protein